MYDVAYKVISEISGKPDVSVVIPVYNGEKYIRRCLEYIVYQTKQEIEAVVVDNLSDDNTLGICKEVQKLFPEKVSIYQLKEHQNYGAVGRNIGVILAKGDYIMFCDADDIMHFKAAELSYAKAIEDDCDLVYFKFYKVENNSIRVCGQVSNTSDKEMIIKGDSSFWTKCFKKELLTNCGIIPDDIISEDFAYVFGSIERAAKIGYVDVPLYYYIKRGDSELHSIFSDKKLDMIKAHSYSLAACEKNNEYMQYVVARHIYVNLTRDWVQLDKFIQHLKELWPVLKENEYLREDITLYKFLEEFVEKTCEPLDTKVYLNGFEHSYSDEEIENIKENIYAETSEVIILNGDNCNVAELESIEQAYHAGNMSFVGEYFALKNIYEQGGVYLDSNIVVDARFNYVRCFKAFIGYLNATEISSYVFGAHKNNKFIGDILTTYTNNFYEDKFYPLSKRMKNILVGKYGYKLSGRTDLFSLEDVSVLGMDYLTLNVPPKSEFNVQPHLCHYKYFDGDDEYVVVNKNAWNYVSPIFLNKFNEKERDRQHLRRDRDNKRKERDTARRDLSRVRRERDNAILRRRQLDYVSDENNRVLEECRRLAAENDRLSIENQLLLKTGKREGNNQLQIVEQTDMEAVRRIEELENTIHQMENSKSWRWTKWLRNLTWRLHNV